MNKTTSDNFELFIKMGGGDGGRTIKNHYYDSFDSLFLEGLKFLQDKTVDVYLSINTRSEPDRIVRYDIKRKEGRKMDLVTYRVKINVPREDLLILTKIVDEISLTAGLTHTDNDNHTSYDDSEIDQDNDKLFEQLIWRNNVEEVIRSGLVIPKNDNVLVTDTKEKVTYKERE